MTDHVAKQILDQVVTTCTGRGRTRFIKELERISEMDYCAIVIESSFSSFTKPPPFSRMNPHCNLFNFAMILFRKHQDISYRDSLDMAQELTEIERGKDAENGEDEFWAKEIKNREEFARQAVTKWRENGPIS